MAMKIERIDHLNITVADIDRSIAFYKKVLGMKTEAIAEGRAALLFGQQKIHLDLAGSAMAMAGDKRMPAHICFVTQSPVSEIKAHLESCGVAVRMEGPRAGAIGTIQSVYIDDPDQNSIEISTYCGRSILDRPGEGQAQLTARTAALCRPGVERRLHCGAVLSVLRRRRDRSPMLQRGDNGRGQDEGVLTDHAQKARAGIAAHLTETLRQRLPEPDNVLARPAGKPGAEAAMLGGDLQHGGGVVAHRFELAPMPDQP